MKNVMLVLLTLTVIWLSAQVIRLEQYHYASFVGMCRDFPEEDPMSTAKRDECLNKTETRTNMFGHLYYGAIDTY